MTIIPALNKLAADLAAITKQVASVEATNTVLVAENQRLQLALSLANSNPFSPMKLWVDPKSPARQQVNAWTSTRPADAAKLERIASQPTAAWFGDWSGDIRTAVDAYVTKLTAIRCLPLLVAYNIPGRDAGNYSAGGAVDDTAYRKWIAGMSDGIGSRKAVVILEPDALALGLPHGSLIGEAVRLLKFNAQTHVYIDAGDYLWNSVATMATRLQAAAVDVADGFALNVAHFRVTSEIVAYGKAISAAVGGKHFVIDTGRNGAGWSVTNPSPEGQPPLRQCNKNHWPARGSCTASLGGKLAARRLSCHSFCKSYWSYWSSASVSTSSRRIWHHESVRRSGR